MVFPDGSGLFPQENAPCHTAKIVWEWFEEHVKESMVLPWPPDSPDLYPIKHPWEVLEHHIQSRDCPTLQLAEIKDLLLMSCCQIAQDTFRGLVESMALFIRAVLVS
ncbi:hypothetical protein JRQ81_019853 [Phrynocephalus forsythii]|uniref:Tc1-like transposase DDE domain-containing protein n=1 Tax=Phrynocephalus forsythii TaxID=171643 RepID=A0A9Q0XPQ5_9SAUR|nr:hypothetical protein JRQ81_019853 [Phrynocephalus forsythii]